MLTVTPAPVSIIIPCFNEERRITATLSFLLDFCSRCFPRFEILLVDDGSTDCTWEIILGQRHPALRPIRLPVNQGKGAAVRAGMLEARGDYCYFTDADLPYDLAAFERAMACFQTGKCELVLGARDLPGSVDRVGMGRTRRAASKVFSATTRLMTGVEIRDSQCGFKGFTARAARLIFSRSLVKGYAFDVEVLILAKRLHLPVCRIPVSLVKAGHSKIRIGRDAFAMLFELIRIATRHRRIESSRP